MKHNLPLTLILFLVVSACWAQDAPQGQQVQALPPIEVFFSPRGGCTEAVVKELGKAQSSVLVQAYSFTNVQIAKALVDAHNRGVKIEVILDKSQKGEKYTSADFVLHAGIRTLIDAKHPIAHNKIMVIDSATVITGSFNFTKAAEEGNAENLLVIRSPELAAKYTANWKVHEEHSDPYVEKEKGYSETHHAAAAANDVSEGYLASKNSQVFHKAGCKGAAKISAKNVIRYATRDEAIQAGKKPCHECNP